MASDTASVEPQRMLSRSVIVSLTIDPRNLQFSRAKRWRMAVTSSLEEHTGLAMVTFLVHLQKAECAFPAMIASDAVLTSAAAQAGDGQELARFRGHICPVGICQGSKTFASLLPSRS
jgi:hypothetical protein